MGCLSAVYNRGYILPFQDEDDSDDEDKAGADFELNDMLSGLRVDKDGNKQSVTDFDDLDDDSDDGEIDGIEDY